MAKLRVSFKFVAAHITTNAMALLTIAEFCLKCGISTKHFTTYVKRNKISLSGDHVDDANQVNQLFISKSQVRQAKKGVKEPGLRPVDEVASRSKKKVSVDDEEGVESTGLVAMERAKRDLEMIKKKNEIKLQEMDIAKRNGELVPTDAVKSLIITHSESLKNAYYEACENLIIEMSTRKQFSSTEISELKTKLRALVNKALENAIAASKVSMVKIVEDYSEKRGVGQHG